MATIDELMGPGAGGKEEPTEQLIAGPEGAADPQRKEVVNYRPAEQGSMEACENCQNFVKPEGCTQVLGKISASAVCDLFEPAETEDLMEGGIDEFLFSGQGPAGGAGGVI